MLRVVAQPAHRLRLARDPLSSGIVQALCLDQREGNVAVEPRVVRQVDLLLAALAQEALDHVAPVRERSWQRGRGWWSRGGSRRRCAQDLAAALHAKARVRGVLPPAVAADHHARHTRAAAAAEAGILWVLAAAVRTAHAGLSFESRGGHDHSRYADGLSTKAQFRPHLLHLAPLCPKMPLALAPR